MECEKKSSSAICSLINTAQHNYAWSIHVHTYIPYVCTYLRAGHFVPAGREYPISTWSRILASARRDKGDDEGNPVVADIRHVKRDAYILCMCVNIFA